MKVKETENWIESTSDRIKISDSTATRRELDGRFSESTKINFFIQNPHQNEPVHAKTFNYEARTNMANNKREKVRSVNKQAISIVTRTLFSNLNTSVWLPRKLIKSSQIIQLNCSKSKLIHHFLSSDELPSRFLNRKRSSKAHLSLIHSLILIKLLNFLISNQTENKEQGRFQKKTKAYLLRHPWRIQSFLFEKSDWQSPVTHRTPAG